MTAVVGMMLSQSSVPKDRKKLLTANSSSRFPQWVRKKKKRVSFRENHSADARGLNSAGGCNAVSCNYRLRQLRKSEKKNFKLEDFVILYVS